MHALQRGTPHPFYILHSTKAQICQVHLAQNNLDLDLDFDIDIYRYISPRTCSQFQYSRMVAVTKRPINLLRGWPNPALLPIPAIRRAAQSALSDSSVSVPGLLYGPDPGFQPLREEISKWLTTFYGGEADAARICITGGASQNLACVLQVYSDPLKTTVWMVAPCYYLACNIFNDAGLRMRAVVEGENGIDLIALEKELERAQHEAGESKVSSSTNFLFAFVL